MKDKKDFWRCVIVQYVPEGVSTAATRCKGLSDLSSFLMSAQFSKHPPKSITTIDSTNELDLHSPDTLFVDSDIVDIVTTTISEDDLDGEFYKKFPQFALKMWSGKFYPDFARNLGFP